MKRKLYLLAVLSLTAFAYTGCGKTEAQGNNAVSETTESKENNTASASDADTSETAESEDTENVEIGGDISKEDFDNLHDEAVENASAVYGDISDITSFYIGRGKQECKMAVPLDYTLAGALQIVDGEEESVFHTGATWKVRDGIAETNPADVAVSEFFITSIEKVPTVIEVLTYDTAEVGNYEDLKQMFSDGEEIGTSELPAWLYDAPETSHDPNADFVLLLPLSDDTVMTVYYRGKLTDTLGREGAAEKVYQLIDLYP